MKNFRTLDDGSFAGKRVLVRADLNVPMQDGAVSDATRIERLVPGLRELAGKGARVIVLSHFGRPKGKRDGAFSLRPVAAALEKALGQDVAFADDCVGPAAEQAVLALQDGGVLVLENVRFHPEEEKNDADFAAKIAKLGDVYVNDAFSAAHRAHATTAGIAGFLPAYAGRLMEAELRALDAALENPAHPVAAIIGGAKISTKIDLLNNLVTRTDTLVLGGGMANTFLHAGGMNVGRSLCEKDMAATARDIVATAEKNKCRIVLPVDAVTAREFAPNPETQCRATNAIRDDDMILDIGARTVEAVSGLLRETKTLLWNGPLGAFETPPFHEGTQELARVAAALTEAGSLVSVAGGGDTLAALAMAGVADRFTYVSTAGGAFLEWLEGKELPGVAALGGAGGAKQAACC